MFYLHDFLKTASKVTKLLYIYWVFHVDRELITNTDKDYTKASEPFHSTQHTFSSPSAIHLL